MEYIGREQTIKINYSDESIYNRLRLDFTKKLTNDELNDIKLVIDEYLSKKFDVAILSMELSNRYDTSWDALFNHTKRHDNFWIHNFIRYIEQVHAVLTFDPEQSYETMIHFYSFLQGYCSAIELLNNDESQIFAEYYYNFYNWADKYLKVVNPNELLLRNQGDSYSAGKLFCSLFLMYVERNQKGELLQPLPFDFYFYSNTFFKYQATGNDFIIIKMRYPSHNSFIHEFILKEETVKKLCDRRLGIGADGFICIYPKYSDADFEMVYYNADGKKGSMCGNGGRSAVKFCLEYFKTYSHKFPVSTEVKILANDEIYHGALHEKGYALRMTEPTPVEHLEENVYFTDTGSPHVVIVLDDAEKLQDEAYFKVITNQYRYDPRFEAGGGTNVNLCYLEGETLKIRTFERGVEDETYSCGTGTVAVTYVLAHLGTVRSLYTIETKGGTLYVEWDETGKIPTLIGPAVCVFTGKLTL